MRSKWVVWGIWMGWLLCGPAWAQKPAPGSKEWVREQARQVHRRGAYPSRLPQARLGQRKKRSGGRSQRVPSWTGNMSGLAYVLFYILLGILAVLLISVLGRFLRESYEGARQATEPEESEAIEMFGLKLPLDLSPEELIQRGDLDLALCVLLLRGMREVGWRDDQRGKSQTVREVVWKVAVTDPRRSPLRELLGMVERVRFGGVLADMQMIEQGMEAYQRILQHRSMKGEAA